MEKKTEIKKLVIEIEGKEISLSVESAEKLYKALDDLFAPKTTTSYPIVVDRYVPYRRWWEYPNVVYCGNNYKATLTGGNTATFSVR